MIRRRIDTLLHGRLKRPLVWLHGRIHPGIPPSAWNLSGGCVLCRIFAWFSPPPPQHLFDSLADHSRVDVDEVLPDLNLPGGVQVVINATVARQLRALMEDDPEAEAALRRALTDIASHVPQQEEDRE